MLKNYRTIKSVAAIAVAAFCERGKGSTQGDKRKAHNRLDSYLRSGAKLNMKELKQAKRAFESEIQNMANILHKIDSDIQELRIKELEEENEKLRKL